MGNASDSIFMLVDPKSALQHFPISMERFGKNPYNENLWRIVFAPSRVHLVHGDFGNSKWVPMYRHIGPLWVLEKWMSADAFAGMSRTRWEREMTILGPWPERGEYQIAHVFEACGPTDANLDKLIMWIEAGNTTSWQDVKDGCYAQYEAEQKDARRETGDKIRDLLPAFGNSALVGYGGIRNPKTKGFNIDPAKLKLPTNNNAFMTGRTRK